MRGIWISTRWSIVAPGASWRVDSDRMPAQPRRQTTAAVEMPAPWKPQTGFHRALEISQRTRDSHIPTSRFLCVFMTRSARHATDDVTHEVTARQTTVS